MNHFLLNSLRYSRRKTGV